MHRDFLYISSPFLPDFDVKMPNFENGIKSEQGWPVV